MRTLVIVGFVVAATLSAAPSFAQDVSATPTYGDVRLKENFLPDPHDVQILAGGSIQVAKPNCSYGHVANAPDVDFYYEGKGEKTLYFFVDADEDTMLLINTPDGTWTCDDDSHEGLNPLVTIRSAKSGLYNVWVGTYGEKMASSKLSISEIDPR